MDTPEGWDLTGKKAVISADRRGWTGFFAAALTEAGADVAIIGSESSDMEDAKNKASSNARKVITKTTDLMSKESIDQSIQNIVNDFGTIDILVNNAKADFGKRFEQVSESEFDTLIDFNLKSMFLTCQSVGHTMLKNKKGHIVNMTSDLAVRGLWNSVIPCASEGAIHQLTSSLALEWGRDGIRVNGIGAGWLTTQNKSDAAEPDLLDRYLPSKRKGHPNDLTQMLVYLSSDSCDFVNGQTIFIDGGALAHA